MKNASWICLALLVACAVLFPECSMAAAAGAKKAPNMMHIVITLATLLIAAVLFFTELIPLAVTATLVPCTLSALGVISVKEAWMGFGDTSILTIVGLFMLGEATFATGFAQKSASWVIHKAGKSETRLLIYAIAMIGIMSAFLNNAGVTAITLPMLVAIAREARMSPSRILLPTAFAASAGGCITLVGTAPNMVVNALLQKMAPGVQPFGFFEFGLYGLPLLVLIVIMYTVFGRWLLPQNRQDTAEVVEEERPLRTEKMYIAGGIFFLVIASMASGFIPLTSAAMLGAMLCIITRCVSIKEAFAAVDWTTIFLFAGMLAMSHAMDKSGAAMLVASSIMAVVSEPYIILALVCAITAIVTNIMSNTATTAVMVPLTIPVALGLGLSPLPFCMGIVASASACFLTPIATPSNTLVLAAGNYTFLDYVRYGWPLQLLAYALTMGIVPLIWPFYV